MAGSKPRFACTNTGCNHKMTRNQLYGSNGKCIYCKVPLNHTNWMTGRQGSLSMLLGLDPSTDRQLQEVCKEADLDIKDAIVAAVHIKLNEWLADPETTMKKIKQDLMLVKLMRP